MSKSNRRSNDHKGKRRRISVRAVRRETPDMRRLGRAIVSLALAEAEAEAKAQADTGRLATDKPAQGNSEQTPPGGVE